MRLRVQLCRLILILQYRVSRFESAPLRWIAEVKLGPRRCGRLSPMRAFAREAPPRDTRTVEYGRRAVYPAAHDCRRSPSGSRNALAIPSARALRSGTNRAGEEQSSPATGYCIQRAICRDDRSRERNAPPGTCSHADAHQAVVFICTLIHRHGVHDLRRMIMPLALSHWKLMEPHGRQLFEPGSRCHLV